MEQIAILTSTSPLRKTTTRHGVTKQRFNMDAVVELSQRFDVVIIGSLSADEVFNYIEAHIPRDSRAKFRLYPRSFFHKFRTDEVMRTTDDPRNAGWEQILSENGIKFEVLRVRIGADNRHRQERFAWDALTYFILDERVLLVSGGEGTLLYDPPQSLAK
jgi:tRNA A22 N-methylase